MPGMIGWRAIAAGVMAGLGCLAAAGEEPPTPVPSAQVERAPAEAVWLIVQLGDDDFSARESAMFKLASLGEAALPVLRKVSTPEASDPETAWRAAAAALMIRWKLTPELWTRMGDLLEEFESADATTRERIVRIVQGLGQKDAIPVLLQVLRTDADAMVKQAAAVMLSDLGSEGLAALMEEGVQIAGLDPYDAGVHVMLGNSFLNDRNFKKAEEHYLRALEMEPGEHIAMYNLACAYSLQNKPDEAFVWLQKAIDAGYDDFEWMEKDEDLDSIRNDARYKEILRKGAKPGNGLPQPDARPQPDDNTGPERPGANDRPGPEEPERKDQPDSDGGS